MILAFMSIFLKVSRDFLIRGGVQLTRNVRMTWDIQENFQKGGFLIIEIQLLKRPDEQLIHLLIDESGTIAIMAENVRTTGASELLTMIGGGVIVAVNATEMIFTEIIDQIIAIEDQIQKDTSIGIDINLAAIAIVAETEIGIEETESMITKGHMNAIAI